MADIGAVRKEFKDMLIGYAKGLSQELIGEYFGYGMLKKLLTKTARGGPTTTGGEGTPEHERHVDVVMGGIFNLSDETAYFSLAGKMSRGEEAKAFAKINAFVKNRLPEVWQKRRFRLILGYLSEIEYETKKVIERGGKEYNPKTGKLKSEKNDKVETKKINLGVQTIKSLARLTDDQIYDICDASGILEPPIIQKAKTFLEEHEGDLLEKIEELRSKIPTSSKTSERRSYQGFFKEMLYSFGVKK